MPISPRSTGGSPRRATMRRASARIWNEHVIDSLAAQSSGCSETSLAVPAADYAEQCSSNGNGPLRTTVLKACPAKAQAMCVNAYGVPNKAYYYLRSPQSLADIRKSCIAMKGEVGGATELTEAAQRPVYPGCFRRIFSIALPLASSSISLSRYRVPASAVSSIASTRMPQDRAGDQGSGRSSAPGAWSKKSSKFVFFASSSSSVCWLWPVSQRMISSTSAFVRPLLFRLGDIMRVHARNADRSRSDASSCLFLCAPLRCGVRVFLTVADTRLSLPTAQGQTGVMPMVSIPAAMHHAPMRAGS